MNSRERGKPDVRVLRAGDRFVTEAEGRTTRHSFSFGAYYDPANLGFAAMVALNDENLPSGTGYPDHPHRDTEIVTWVLEGALRHTVSAGTTGVLEAGDVQRVSAGSGIVHSEYAEPGQATRFLQTWLRPDEPGGDPSYAAARGVGPAGLTEVVGPRGLPVATGGARLYLAQTGPGRLVLPDAPQLHVFLVAGQARLGAHDLGAGDEARLVDQGGRELQVGTPLTAAVWAFGA